MAVDDTLRTRVAAWITDDPDPETRAVAADLLHAAEAGDATSEATLRDAFSGRLSFGTAGLRAELGPGPARMNRVVVSQTSAGFAAYLLQRAARGEASTPPSVVIGYDGRTNSDVFARDAAEIMAGAGLSVTLLPEPLPTPVTAFAVRSLGASAGVMITASHNPPRDNGYKVYLGDADHGSQIIPPADADIATQIALAAERPLADLPRSQNVRVAGNEIRDAYLDTAATALRNGWNATSLDPDTLNQQDDFRIVYTAMHGVGSALAQELFARVGLPSVTVVPEQDQPDGTFPTVAFPNPEEPGALDLAFRTAREIDAHLVVAHDPDADRLAIALPDPSCSDGYRRLSGNELGLLLGWRAAERSKALLPDSGAGAPAGALACTIVSSPALGAVAKHYGLTYAETLSGFKWVSRVPRLLYGFEEAIGYLTHPEVVHDKDGVLASADAIAMALECHRNGSTVWELLDEASMTFGHFSSAQVVLRLASMNEVATLAEWVRAHPPTSFGEVPVAVAHDLRQPGVAEVPANVLRYDLADGSRVMIRPSGTEPKLKVYLDAFSDQGSLAERRAATSAALETIESAVRDYLDRASE